jgi:hypothetical protein
LPAVADERLTIARHASSAQANLRKMSPLNAAMCANNPHLPRTLRMGKIAYDRELVTRTHWPAHKSVALSDSIRREIRLADFHPWTGRDQT